MEPADGTAAVRARGSVSTAANVPTSHRAISPEYPLLLLPLPGERHPHWLAEDARMDALDLTTRPPRGPREPLADLDLLMIARTVDKIRATLPGGNIGSYQITGFSSRLLDTLGIAEALLRDTIARADSDAQVAAWIREHSSPSRYPEINAKLEGHTIGERLGDAEFVARYPIVKRLPPETSRLDMLAADDKEMFGS